jgi:hypothetical protein
MQETQRSFIAMRSTTWYGALPFLIGGRCGGGQFNQRSRQFPHPQIYVPELVFGGKPSEVLI